MDGWMDGWMQLLDHAIPLNMWHDLLLSASLCQCSLRHRNQDSEVERLRTRASDQMPALAARGWASRRSRLAGFPLEACGNDERNNGPLRNPGFKTTHSYRGLQHLPNDILLMFGQACRRSGILNQHSDAGLGTLMFGPLNQLDIRQLDRRS